MEATYPTEVAVAPEGSRFLQRVFARMFVGLATGLFLVYSATVRRRQRPP